jgi:hypothetical protein
MAAGSLPIRVNLRIAPISPDVATRGIRQNQGKPPAVLGSRCRSMLGSMAMTGGWG